MKQTHLLWPGGPTFATAKGGVAMIGQTQGLRRSIIVTAPIAARWMGHPTPMVWRDIMKRTHLLCFLLGGLLLGPGIRVSRAGPITWEFSGEIFFVRDDSDFLGGAIVEGTPFSGSFTFESMIMDSDPEPLIGFYESVVLNIEGQVGDVSFTGPLGGNFIQIVDKIVETSSDFYALEADVGFLGERFAFALLGPGSSNLFADDSLPLVAPDFEAFGTPLRFSIVDETEVLPFGILGTVDVLVPEPTTALLLVGGLAVGLLRRPGNRDRL